MPGCKRKVRFESGSGFFTPKVAEPMAARAFSSHFETKGFGSVRGGSSALFEAWGYMDEVVIDGASQRDPIRHILWPTMLWLGTSRLRARTSDG